MFFPLIAGNCKRGIEFSKIIKNKNNGRQLPVKDG
jgi:hypothetical protein